MSGFFYGFGAAVQILRGSAINVASIADLDDEYAQRIVLDIADDAVVAHAVAPQTSKWPSQRFTHGSRVSRLNATLAQISGDPFGGRVVEFG